MSYWKSKVVPKLKKLFDKGGKKKGAADACKHFYSSKESLEKEIGEKTTNLNPKVIEIYRSSTIISKKLLKEPSESTVKKNPDEAQGILQELAKAGFPGAQELSDAGGKYGPALLPGPIVYLFEKTSTFLVEEPLPVPEPEQEKREITIETLAEEKATEPEAKGEVAATPQLEPVTPVEESGVPNEEKKEVTPIIEAKKEEPIAVVAAKKEEVAPIEAKKEVTPVEAKKEAPAAKEVTTEEAPAAKEVKKEEAATPSDSKEKVAPPPEGKKEEVITTPTLEEKKEKPT